MLDADNSRHRGFDMCQPDAQQFSKQKGTSVDEEVTGKIPICRRRAQMAYSPEVARPNEHRNPPQVSAVAPADDIRTIMLNQVSWGAVFAGATIALIMQIILNMVGVGVGLSTIDVAAGDSPSAGSLSVGAGVWWVISGIVAAAVGGYVAGQLSGTASQSTTAYHGLLAWALSTLIVVYLLSSAASGLIGGALSTASTALGGAGKAIGGGRRKAAPHG